MSDNDFELSSPPLTQEQMRNQAIAGLAVEIAALRTSIKEIGQKTDALHNVFLEKQPGQSDTLADRLLRDDMQRRAAEIVGEQWLAKMRNRGLIVSSLMLLGAFVTGMFAVLLKLSNHGGQP